ncbi:hypothetical protein CBS101457_004432 [Exobasidium rhododendri]|nr:hypothetical protein CBS101457_004432 [Exobasidium rhododendri]
MSLDLSWALLDEEFTTNLQHAIDKVLFSASKPAFIGPIHLSALHLGNEAPEISIVDVGDVWQGFLDGEEGQRSLASPSRSQPQQNLRSHQQGRERGGEKTRAVSDSSQDHFAKFAEKNLPFGMLPEEGCDSKGMHRRSSQKRQQGNRLHTYRQYSDSGNAQLVDTGSMSNFDQSATLSIPPTPSGNHWGPGLLPSDRPFSSHGSNAGGYFSAWQGAPSPSISARSALHARRPQTWRRSSASVLGGHHQSNSLPYTPVGATESPHSSSSLPSLQLHLSLHWNTSSIRMTINTSLLINHPSPAFMSLPLSITITGLVLQAGGLLAFEVDPVTNTRKGHFCLVVEEEEEEGEEEGEQEVQVEDEPTDDVVDLAAGSRSVPIASLRSKVTPTPTTGIGSTFGMEQNISSGEKILSNITLETSVGQVDKHVLRNVAKVERFVISLVRKAIGDELVFPNFYSIELP